VLLSGTWILQPVRHTCSQRPRALSILNRGRQPHARLGPAQFQSTDSERGVHSAASGFSHDYESEPRIRPRRDIRGKVAIVTGAGSRGEGIGNGRATSMLLAEDGASVVCVDQDLQLARYTVDKIEKNSPKAKGRAVAVAADVTQRADCERIIKATLASFGHLDILVNIVGIMGAKGTAIDVDPDEWAKGLEINVSSMMLMAKYAIPAMLKNERSAENPIRGSIVNIGSVAGLQGGTPHLMYPTSKGAVVNMTRAMAAHHGVDGIRVNCVCPGKSISHYPALP
jgi:NAD(P)-dependent dehydrogenase (short-subunit alcohol dehydrogenase family)